MSTLCLQATPLLPSPFCRFTFPPPPPPSCRRCLVSLGHHRACILWALDNILTVLAYYAISLSLIRYRSSGLYFYAWDWSERGRLKRSWCSRTVQSYAVLFFCSKDFFVLSFLLSHIFSVGGIYYFVFLFLVEFKLSLHFCPRRYRICDIIITVITQVFKRNVLHISTTLRIFSTFMDAISTEHGQVTWRLLRMRISVHIQ